MPSLCTVPVILGPFSFPVSVESAVAGPESDLNLVCTGAGSTPHEPRRIKMPTVCPECGEVSREHLDRGKQVGDKVIAFTTAELDALNDADEHKGHVTLVKVNAAELEAATLPSGKAYWLGVPSKNGVPKAYALLRAAVSATPGTALVGKFTIRSVAAICRVTLRDGALMLEQLCFPEDVRAAPRIDAEADADDLDVLASWLAVRVAPFDPAEWADTRRKAVEEFVAERIAQQVPTVAPAVAGGAVVNLMAALKADVDAARKQPRKSRSRKAG